MKTWKFSSLILVLLIGFWASPLMANSWAPPEDISTTGHLVTDLFMYTTKMNIFFFALVCAGLFGFSYKYSAKRNKTPYFTYGNSKKQIILVTIIGSAVFFMIDMSITVMSTRDVINTFWNFPKGEEAKEVLKVEVMAQQWMWNFRYAGEDGEFNTADDVLSNHDLYLPAGKKVEFRITSKDVIHSFYLPNAKNKVDAMPGRISRMWFHPQKTGVYDIACAEMCGTHHYMMKAKMIIFDEEQFKNWNTEAQRIAKVGNDADNKDLYWGWKWETN